MCHRDVFSRFRRGGICFFFLGVFISILPCPGFAQTNVTLAWNPSTNPIVAGYKIYYGGASGNYTNKTSVGSATSFTVSNLLNGGTYYFAASTYSAAGAESALSTEVSYTVPVTVNAVNQQPTLNPLNNLTVNENAGAQSVNLSGISAGAGNQGQTLTVTASSSNPALIPNPAVTYTSPNVTGSLAFTPTANTSGSATITVTVNDGGASNNIVTQSFTVTVNAGNLTIPLAMPGSLTLVSPVGGGSVASNLTQRYTWQADSNAVWYELYVMQNGKLLSDQWFNSSNSVIVGTTGDFAVDVNGHTGGSYQWWVRGWNQIGLGPWSATGSYTMSPPPPPDKITLVSPAGGGSVVANTVQRYTWQIDTNTVWYELYVMQNGKLLSDQWFNSSNSVINGTTGDFAVDVDGHTGGSYQWWVRGWSPIGYGPWSDTGSFTMTAPPPPGQVTLLTPTNNAGGVVREPTLTWTASSPAASWYDVYVVRNGTKYLDQWVQGTTNLVVANNGLPGGAYTWYVRPWNAVGLGPWSAGSSFTIQTATPGVLTLLSPTGSVASGSTQLYTWQADANATWYELYVMKNGSEFTDQWFNLSDSVVDSATGDFGVNVAGHTNGSYQWWVRAWGPDGFGPWSTSMSFQITKPTLAITSPTPNQQWSNATFTATFKAADNTAVAAVYYSLNGAPWTNATAVNSWTNWSASLQLNTGANTLQAYALDTGGNASATNIVSFEYVATIISAAISSSVMPVIAAPAILSPASFADGQYALTVLGTTNAQYIVQASTDLVNWVSVQTNTPPFTFTDIEAGQYNQRYYRAVSVR